MTPNIFRSLSPVHGKVLGLNPMTYRGGDRRSTLSSQLAHEEELLDVKIHPQEPTKYTDQVKAWRGVTTQVDWDDGAPPLSSAM